MFSKAHREALREASSGISGKSRRQLLCPTLPDKYTLCDIEAYLATALAAEAEMKLAVFSVIEAALNDERLQPPNDPTVSKLLCDGIVDFLSPDGHIFDSEHPKYTKNDTSRPQWRSAFLLALKSVARLLEMSACSKSNSVKLNTVALRSLMAYTNPDDAWSSQEASDVALDILAQHGQRAHSAEFITHDILQDYIRPLFKKSRPFMVTEQGRKSTVERLPNERHSRILDPVKKPWRFEEVAAITIFRWAIVNSDKELMSSNWHLFIPPVLTLLDDPSTPIRLSGMTALSELLDKVPLRMLEQTGLGAVMEEAMIPTLSFLPTLTPVDESLLLLNAAYNALLKLTDVRFVGGKASQKRQKVLDKLLREGVLHGIDHCHQNTEIILLLLTIMEKLIHRMGIQTIKHLKDITPTLYTLLMDPFAPKNPDNLLQGIKALQGIVLNSWLVLSEDRHRLELVKAMTVCWIHINDESLSSGSQKSQKLKDAQHQLRITAALLSKSMPEDAVFMNDVEQLMRVEPKVASLFERIERG